MPTVKIKDLSSAEVGEIELVDAVFSVALNAAMFPAQGESSGSRRAPGGRALRVCDRRCGRVAAMRTDHNRGTGRITCPRR